jgi:hypothetical protein
MDMDEKIDVIFGETWMKQHKATLCYGSNTCPFTKRGRNFLVRCAKPRSCQRTQVRSRATVKAQILTTTQTKRVLRKMLSGIV